MAREKEKLRSDLEKAEKLKSLMASEVDDHHAAIERRNEYNLRYGVPVHPSSGCPGGQQVDHEPAACPGCQEGQWDQGVH